MEEEGIEESNDISPWRTLALAFQTLGVVYDDMGTSSLYVFFDVFSKVPITSEVDVLGALSLVMYTIALTPLTKYVFVVLKANDNGEGETFALYSPICRSTTDIANAYGIAGIGVMIVSMTLVTLIMLFIWQTNLFLAICFPLVFGTIELIYLSTVLSKITEGARVPGIGLLYNELVQGIPPIFGHKEALELALESNQNKLEFDHISTRSKDRIVRARDSIGELMHDQVSDEAGMFALPSSVMSADEDPSLEYKLSALREATASGFTYLLDHGDVSAKKTHGCSASSAVVT
ncbi:potassium transporter 12 isoform X2 [Olea europaea subsp. europaea]|uniref:Potassium transporter 12 isoform X2 n=1 Tax=Olea europaea subsp. europaea TaxID=158383 RepID=A0A8S0TNB6_OLEEU|nr:potassium transporter 12 isoform X2 [Olea europaea subsp. europaea]